MGVFAVLLLAGLLIFVLGSSYYIIFPTNKSAAYKLSLPVLFLVLALLLRNSDRFSDLWLSFYALFGASAANYLVWQFVPWIQQTLKISTDSLRGMAWAKLTEAVFVIGTILILMQLAGVDLAAIYLQLGAVLPGIAFGLISLVVFGMIAAQQAKVLHIPQQTIITLLPWIVTFVCANALMEEVWFRGLFLQGFELALDPTTGLLLTAIIFTLAHIGADYLSCTEKLQFLVILFPLALAWGFWMQKTGSMLGSVISHAGADVLILNGYIASLHGEENSNQLMQKEGTL